MAHAVHFSSLKDHRLYINRELSWLAFDRRVLELARDPQVPLLERLRFLIISANNLDEFFEIRVAGLKQQAAFGVKTAMGPDGMTPVECLAAISEAARKLIAEQYALLQDVLLPALAEEGVRVLRRSDWTAKQQKWIKSYFLREVMPVVTPMGLDPAHPFPKVRNKNLCFILRMSGRDAFDRDGGLAVIQAPRTLPRLIALPPECARGPHDFVLLSSVIHANAPALFPGMRLDSCAQFRLTRDSELWVEDEEAKDLKQAIQGELNQRPFGDAVRLETADNCDRETTQYLLECFGLAEQDLYRVNGPVNLSRLGSLYDSVDRPDLKYPPFHAHIPRELSGDIFATLRRCDVLLHHPYQSFSPVIDFLRQAAADPDVVALRITLYRTGANSPIADALTMAARAGKEVTVVVELRARFDEEANISLATRLQDAGANVVYGVVSHKAHAKMLQVVRREADGLRRYVHLGTGNYHARTAATYTDFGLMSARAELGRDVDEVFRQLTGLGKVAKLSRLLQSPFTLHDRLLELIEAEADQAREGKPAFIRAKMNALSEPAIIQALYRASRAGVKVDLIVRGVCCLRPGVAGVSENIRVRSIVGRFLEHARVFHFHAGGAETTYCASADWMERNLLRRVETAFPIEDPILRQRVVEEALTLGLADNINAWELAAEGHYTRLTAPSEAEAVSLHERLLEKWMATDPRS